MNAQTPLCSRKGRADGPACPKCRYDLSATPDGVCPECGRAFTRAELASRAAAARAEALRSAAAVRAGLRLTAVALVAAVELVGAWMFVDGAWSMLGGYGWSETAVSMFGMGDSGRPLRASEAVVQGLIIMGGAAATGLFFWVSVRAGWRRRAKIDAAGGGDGHTDRDG